jgi:type III restriction enzyme
MVKAITSYLFKSDYTDDGDKITAGYHDAEAAGTMLPFRWNCRPIRAQILQLIYSMYSDAQIPLPMDDRETKHNKLNSNFRKAEFRALWNCFHQRAVHSVQFGFDEPIGKCIADFDDELRVRRCHMWSSGTSNRPAPSLTRCSLARRLG